MAFVPTHPEVDGPAGHFQEMIKRYAEEGAEIISDIDEGEQAEEPTEKPDSQ